MGQIRQDHKVLSNILVWYAQKYYDLRRKKTQLKKDTDKRIHQCIISKNKKNEPMWNIQLPI